MNRVPTSEGNILAEEQLQQELRFSNQSIAEPMVASTVTDNAFLPISHPPKDNNERVMFIDSSANRSQILGKRVPSSPVSEHNRPRKSKYGFSQEEPVSQDPGQTVADQRRQFLATRKQETQKRMAEAAVGESMIKQQSPFLSPTDCRMDEGSVPQFSTISSSPPLHSSPRAAYARQNAEIQGQEVHSSSHDERRDDARPETPEMMDEDIPITYETLHREFCAAYTDYKGNIKHFTNLLRDIDRSRNPLHPFLWDDYVIRNKTDYLPYSMECLESGERPISYENYYAKRITKPLYTMGILSASKLDALPDAETRRYDGQHASHSVEADTIRPRSSYNSPRRERDRGVGSRTLHEIPPGGDRYVPEPRSTAARLAAPASARAQAPRKPKSGLVMMSLGSGPVKKHNVEHKNSAARGADILLSKVSKAEQPRPSAPSASTAGAQPRRSLPWGTVDNTSRPGHDQDDRASSASDVRRSSNSEYGDFFQAYRSLSSVQEDVGSKDKPRRRINVLAWNLDPL